jgi:hypothetical protein
MIVGDGSDEGQTSLASINADRKTERPVLLLENVAEKWHRKKGA